jgi:hypothetical protein
MLILAMTTEPRTTQQNKSLHLWCTQIAEILNDAGFDVRIVLEKLAEYGVNWTPQMVKILVIKNILRHQVGHDKTSLLSKQEFPELIEETIRFFGERIGIYVPYPSIEWSRDEERE